MYHRIFVPVDGSDPSNCGLMEAIKLAQNQDAKIRLLHVVDEHVVATAYDIGGYTGDLIAPSLEAGKQVLSEAAALVRQFGLEPESGFVESLSGDASSLIAAQAKAWSADLIVMGTHGRRGLKRLALGSEAESVVRRTRIPVLLVHDGSENNLDAQKVHAAVLSSQEAASA
jgi:nucleotide-binding universal stress UspA family protein